MIKMNVLRMMALYMDHVICLLSLKEAGAFLTVKHRYTPNKSMSTSTEKKNKMFNKSDPQFIENVDFFDRRVILFLTSISRI